MRAAADSFVSFSDMAARKKKESGHGAGKALLFLLVLCGALLLRFGQGEPLRRARETMQTVAGQQLEALDYETAIETMGRGFARMIQPEGILAEAGRLLLGLKSGGNAPAENDF